VRERWSQRDSLFADAAGPGRHRIRIDPYNSRHRVWVVDESYSVIYIFSNDGSNLIKTHGEKGVQGTDGTHFCTPQDVAFLPDGRILIADGLDNHRVMILDRDMKYIGEFGVRGTGPGRFNGVDALATGPEGRLFIPDRSGHRIKRLQNHLRPHKNRFRRSVHGILDPARHNPTAFGLPTSVPPL
jgi:hypothetical protein